MRIFSIINFLLFVRKTVAELCEFVDTTNKFENVLWNKYRFSGVCWLTLFYGGRGKPTYRSTPVMKSMRCTSIRAYLCLHCFKQFITITGTLVFWELVCCRLSRIYSSHIYCPKFWYYFDYFGEILWKSTWFTSNIVILWHKVKNNTTL